MAAAADERGDPVRGRGTAGKKKSVLSTAARVGAWILLGAAGFMLNEGLTWLRDKAMEKPDYLQQLAKSQGEQFERVRASLGEISGSLQSGDRKAFQQVKSAVAELGNTHASLIQQLVLAKKENDVLRQATSDRGIAGGYDFLLAEGSGIRIDQDTVLGVKSVSTAGTRVNLTASGADSRSDTWLEPGMSLPFTNRQGASCKVSLLSTNKAPVGTASFVVGCGEGMANRAG